MLNYINEQVLSDELVEVIKMLHEARKIFGDSHEIVQMLQEEVQSLDKRIWYARIYSKVSP